MKETGFCWRCGKVIKKGLFCNKKCEYQYNKEQERYIHEGKRRGYGAAGSTR